MKQLIRIFLGLLLLLVFIFYQQIFGFLDESSILLSPVALKIKYILLLGSIAWLLIEVIKLLKNRLLKRFDISSEDNLKSRKYHTQINLLEKVINIVIVIGAVGLMMLSIEKIREIGIGILASAGVVGLIVGLSAQKIIGAILAGIQIAVAQPFRIDDAVVVENEWGWIEEINLTFIVVRLWDKRRLVLPSTYFLEKPFQNWTRSTADIVGSVFLYTDYTIPVDALREELTRILNDTDLWDSKANVLQVTDSKENYMEIRILVSAKNSPTAWDLRVHVREQMIKFIQEKYPESLPKTRVSIME